jgi:plastocyanin
VWTGLLALGLVLAACSPSAPDGDAPAGGPADGEIELRAVAFVPDEITTSAGSTVTWTNTDGFDHTVTAGTAAAPEEHAFHSTLGEGDTYSQVFDEAGLFDFFCQIHPVNMTGTVTVR